MNKTFRRGFRYLPDGTEHRGDCRCGKCLEFDTFLEKRFPGLTETRMVKGKPVKVGIR
jgi:hypothetical protein